MTPRPVLLFAAGFRRARARLIAERCRLICGSRNCSCAGLVAALTAEAAMYEALAEELRWRGELVAIEVRT